MLKSLRKILLSLATGATIVTIALMWASAYSAHISPEKHGWLDVLGLCFPIFAAGNLIALAGWLLIKPRRAIIPLIGFAACFSDLRAYCPVNIPQPAPKGCLKIMSYNAMNFGCNTDNPQIGRLIIDDIISAKADIVCLQEGQYCCGWNEAEKKLRKTYPYIASLNEDTTIAILRCFSRYPITEKKTLPIESSGNSVGVFRITLEKGDTIHVINCHMQSDNLTKDDRNNYKELVKGEKRSGARTTIFSLVKKLSHAAQIRSSQADSIKKYIRQHKNDPIILCGDFNDSPISYPRREISKLLTDTYKTSGLGPGFSFNRDGMFVRIDHLFCSEHWTPYDATVDRSAKHSDHYPIYAFLKRKSK